MTAGASTMTGAADPVPVPAESYEEKAFGFWLYLMSDTIIFALLFATYVIMLGNTAGGPTGKELFSLKRAAGETALLLLSSAAFGFAAVALANADKSRVLLWLLVTVVLGAGFLSLEFGEFRGMIAQGAGPDRSGFLSALFTLVGTHGLHVSVGILWILVMIGQVLVKGLTTPVVSRLARLGLFWHFLDIIWVAIFSVVYLPGVL
jgi:cytochrome o ubiquinol oxidase subunit III